MKQIFNLAFSNFKFMDISSYLNRSCTILHPYLNITFQETCYTKMLAILYVINHLEKYDDICFFRLYLVYLALNSYLFKCNDYIL